MSDEKKTKVEEAMEKYCIILVAVQAIIDAISPKVEGSGHPSVKCTGPICAQYDQFNNICRLT